MTEVLSSTDVAYAAGIIDGEGTISIHDAWQFRKDGTKRHYHHAFVKIANTNFALIRWFTERFGGIYYEIKGRGNCKKWYSWQITGKSSIPILQAVLPYLVLKRRQAEIALECQATLNRHCPVISEVTMLKRCMLKQEINKLNQRGVIPVKYVYTGHPDMVQ